MCICDIWSIFLVFDNSLQSLACLPVGGRARLCLKASMLSLMSSVKHKQGWDQDTFTPMLKKHRSKFIPSQSTSHSPLRGYSSTRIDLSRGGTAAT